MNIPEPAGPCVVEAPIEDYNVDQFEGGNNEAHPIPEPPDHPPAAHNEINQELPMI